MSTPERPFLLRLNKQALEALFPEGSEARVDLQKAVVANFVSVNLRPHTMGPDLEKIVNDARAEYRRTVSNLRADVVRTSLADAGIKTDLWGRPTLQDATKKDLARLAEGVVRDTVYDAATKAAQNAAESMSETIEAIVERRVAKIIDTEVTKRVQARVEAAMAALKT